MKRIFSFAGFIMFCLATIQAAADVLSPPEGTACGGFAGVMCPAGYYCEYFRKDITDAQGVCKKINEPPRPPTLLSPPPISPSPIVVIDPRQPAVELRWQNNGDPDGDPVVFWINLARSDAQSQRWNTVFTGYLQGTSFTFTRQQGLEGNSCYAWQVLAIDPYQHSKPSYAATDWAIFCTAVMPESKVP